MRTPGAQVIVVCRLLARFFVLKHYASRQKARIANKQQMENYEFAQSSTPVHSLLHACECDPSQTANQGLFYVNNPNDQDGDARLYDLGRFTIATQGMQATGYNLGELWVSYKICLLKPKLVGV
jgi:hypothetical protein